MMKEIDFDRLHDILDTLSEVAPGEINIEFFKDVHTVYSPEHGTSEVDRGWDWIGNMTVTDHSDAAKIYVFHRLLGRVLEEMQKLGLEGRMSANTYDHAIIRFWIHDEQAETALAERDKEVARLEKPSATTESGQLCSTEATMNKGDNGSHWDGCEEAHHDCALAKLKQAEAEVAKWVQRTYDEQEAKFAAMQERDELRSEVDRLKAQCERLAREGDQLQADFRARDGDCKQAEAALAERDKMLEEVERWMHDNDFPDFSLANLRRRVEET